MDWARVLAYITGTVGQELLFRNEYLSVVIIRPSPRADITEGGFTTG